MLYISTRLASQFRHAKQIMQVSDQAYNRLKELLSNKPQEIIGVKIGVKKRGCNGLSYTMDYTTQASRLDEVIDHKDIQIIVDSKAVMFLIGTTMDYINTQVSSEFVFHNPNAKGTCGCGESFNV